ncbi:MAG: CapA family protein [Candidatus Hydrogenedentota bacterium]|nr:MAG: CapA family protein [Candidatus Hydrogenedentota bacterium]
MKHIILAVLLLCIHCKQNKAKSLKKSKSNLLTIVAVGDIVHPCNTKLKKVFSKLGSNIYSRTRKFLQSADLTFGNLEAPLTKQKTKRPKIYKYQFTGFPEEARWLREAGFNLLSMANNHIYDAGKKGVKDTFQYLEKQREFSPYLKWTGAGLTKKQARKYLVFSPQGKNFKVAFLAYSYCCENKVNLFRLARVKRDIRTVKKQADFIIVSIHYGREYTHIPSRKKRIKYKAVIKAGADLILGHHPHVAQGVQFYHHGFIAYSLGNFAMGTKTSRYKKRKAKMYSMALRLTVKIENKKVSFLKTEIFPLYTNNAKPFRIKKKKEEFTPFIPKFSKGIFAKRILKYIQKWSKQLPQNKTRFILKKDKLIAEILDEGQKGMQGATYAP